MVAAAIGGAAVLGAGASAVAGSKAAKAQKNAAATAAAASETATQLQVDESKRQYDLTRADYAPYRAVGYGAVDKLAGMVGVTPQNADGTPTTVNASGGTGLGYQGDGGFTASPGYQFRLDQGVQAAERSAAARGSLASGGTLKAITRYADGLASSKYDNYANRIAALAGVGQSATGSTAAAGAAATGAITSAYGQNGQIQANAATAAGNARASSYANTGASISGAANGLAQTYFASQKVPAFNGLLNSGNSYSIGGGYR